MNLRQSIMLLFNISYHYKGDGTGKIDPLDIDSDLFEKEINDVLVKLNKNQQYVIIHRFGLLNGEGETLDEVSKVLGLTPERIRQIETKALRLMRNPRFSNILVNKFIKCFISPPSPQQTQ